MPNQVVGLMVVVTELHSSIWSGFGHDRRGGGAQPPPSRRPSYQGHQAVKKKRRMDGESEIFQFGGDQNLVPRKERITQPFNFKPSKCSIRNLILSLSTALI